MKILETKYVNTKDIVIGRCIVRPIEEMKEDNEDLINLSNSIEVLGQLHPCLVRIVNSKYELIAGGRRYAVLSQKDNQIEVKIVDATDLEALELGITENLHRKNLDDKQRDIQIYRLWKYGEKSGQYKNIKDLSKKIAMSEGKLRDIITEGGTREKHKESEIIQKAKTTELVKTRPLSEHLGLREKILDLGHKKDITIRDMGDISKKIKKTIDNGVDKKIVEKAIDLALMSKETSEDEKKDIITDDTDTSIRSGVFQPKKFVEVLDILKESPEDIQKKIVNKKISLEAAKEINEFETKEAREQMSKENIKIEKWKEKSAQLYDNEWKKNVEIRKQQEQDVKNSGDTNLKTRFDLEYQRKLEMEKTKDQRFDEEYIRRYQGLKSDVNGLIAHFHPRKLKTDKGKEIVPDILKGIYTLLRQVLIEIGEIKVGNADGLDFIDINVKAEDIKDDKNNKIKDDIVIVKTQ